MGGSGAMRRRVAEAGRALAKRTAAALDRVQVPGPGVVVLIYHRVGRRSSLQVDLPTPLFAEQMARLAATARVVSLDRALALLEGDPPSGPPPVVVTFDDGTADFLDEALPVLATHRLPATLYVATDFIERGRPFPADGAPVPFPGRRRAGSLHRAHRGAPGRGRQALRLPQGPRRLSFCRGGGTGPLRLGGTGGHPAQPLRSHRPPPAGPQPHPGVRRPQVVRMQGGGRHGGGGPAAGPGQPAPLREGGKLSSTVSPDLSAPEQGRENGSRGLGTRTRRLPGPEVVSMSRPRLVHLTTTDMSLALLLGPQLEAFTRAGYEVVGVSAPGRFVAGLVEAGIRHISLTHATRAMSPVDDARAMAEFYGLCRMLRPDIVHTHNPKPGLYGRLAARAAGVPVVVNTVHGLYATRDDSWRRRAVVYGLERLAAACSDAELVQNPEDLETLAHLGVPRRRLHRLGNGIDLERFRPTGREEDRAKLRAEWGASEGTVVVGAVGRLVGEK